MSTWGETMEMKPNDRKVIPLNAKFKKQSVKTTPNDLRAAATATIAFMLFLMVGFNFSMFQVDREEQIAKASSRARGIASVPKNIEPAWQKNLAQMNPSMISHSARKPTALEALSFGSLEGKYAMRIDGGRITQIELSDMDRAQPKVLSDRISFIQKNALALAPGFKAAEKVRVEASDIGTKEIYKVQTASGFKTFEFQIDGQDRFISLDIK